MDLFAIAAHPLQTLKQAVLFSCPRLMRGPASPMLRMSCAPSQRVGLVPPEFRQSQVDALFSDVKTLLIGSVAAFISVVVVSLRTGSAAVGAVAVLLGLLSLFRVAMVKRYALCRTTLDASKFTAWERAYDLAAAAHVGLLGIFCAATFVASADECARMMSLATAFAYLSGIPGRNFASPAGVDLQVASGMVPVFVAMAIAGGPFWLLSIIVLVPFVLALRGMAARLRTVFVQAVTRASDLSELASRFDTALTNMPHGLAMFDQGGRIEVYNDRFLTSFGIDAASDAKNKPIMEVLSQALPSESTGQQSLKAIGQEFTAPSSRCFDITVDNGATLELRVQSKPTGGAVAVVQDVTDRKRAEERITQLAHYDELTKLANRRFFGSLLESGLSVRQDGERSHALLFVDLDHFKQINDTLGHSYGDKLLQQVAERLRSVADLDAAIARFGGDEFVILQRLRKPGDAEGLASRLIEEVSKPYFVDDYTLSLGASIGIANIPEHGRTLETLLRKADLALYRAKERRGCFMVFEPEMDAQAKDQNTLKADLRDALAKRQFELFYQPIYDIETGRFTVCEALLRWRHPSRGLISPADFIPVIEEMGLIVEIGEWVIRQACLDCSGWPAGVRVAVNISSVQFRSSSLVPNVAEALAVADLAPQRLELELTESVLLQDLSSASVIMRQLRALNIGIALDDFG
ncbi:MAG: diguanylate cyclase, partial [Methylobacterium mesophilicum]|nr:diguanylate cyclase [Methylobacterium mesophilicum]